MSLFYFSEDNDTLSLEGGVWSIDGKKSLIKKKQITVKVEDEEPPKKVAKKEETLYAGIMATKLDKRELSLAQELGISLAEELIEAGGLDIMQEARLENEKPDAKEQIAKLIEEAEKNGKEKSAVTS
jgi:hypothetical protein